MMKKKFIISFFILLTTIQSQTITQIKSSPQYLWGEGQAQRPENLVGFQNLQGLGVHAPGKNLAGHKDLQGLSLFCKRALNPITSFCSNLTKSNERNKMTTKLKHIIEEAKDLSAKEKAFIARCLISSLDVPPEEGAEEAWIELVEKRFEELESGEVESVEWNDIKKSLRI